jgi:hypothetical protein
VKGMLRDGGGWSKFEVKVTTMEGGCVGSRGGYWGIIQIGLGATTQLSWIPRLNSKL